jgi:hypothetical protein
MIRILHMDNLWGGVHFQHVCEDGLSVLSVSLLDFP